MYIENLTEIDLFIAYKKVKFELFKDKNSVTTIDLFEYERELVSNINILYKDIEKNGLKNITCSDYYEVPKSLEIKDAQTDKKPKDSKVHFYTSSMDHHKLSEEKFNDIELKFRKVINANINFHIISALWIAKIGQHIDSKFGNNIYGSRLIRIKPSITTSCEYDVANQEYNQDSPKIFEPYHHKYKSWRNNSFKSIRELHKTSSVVAITMDITSFFHTVKLNEFVTDEFYKEFELDMLFKSEPTLKKFHEDFVANLNKWNKSISEDNKISDGLPIGLSASYVLANAVMRGFDKKIEDNLAPTYYGRYVDDILLVFPDNGNLKNGEDVIKYLLSKGVIEEKKSEEGIMDLGYKYFILKKAKQKIFYLDKNADLSIIDGIEAEINSVSSEWRFMPDIGNDKSSLLEKVIGFYADGEEFNDALRKIDATTIKRLGLSLLISHTHSLNQYVHPKEWKEQRYKIYDLIENHIFMPQNFFSSFSFIPQIFRLMIHSEDGERAYCFLEKVFLLIDEFNNRKDIATLIPSNGKNINFSKFEEYSIYLLQEVFTESFNVLNKMHKRYSKKIIDLLFYKKILYKSTKTKFIDYYNAMNKKETKKDMLDFNNIYIPEDYLDEKILKEINAYLFLRDLSFDGYAVSSTEYVLTQNKKSLFSSIINKYRGYIDFDITLYDKREAFLVCIDHFNRQLSKKNKSNMPLIFPTRLFSVVDISIVSSLSEYSYGLFKYYVNYLRGNHSLINDLEINSEESPLPFIDIQNKYLEKAKTINIAITNFEVRDDYWRQSVVQKPVKTIERYNQISQIVKEAVKKRPDYLVLPELAMPQEWAWLISKKLLSNHISLITGVEYIHSSRGKDKIVHNAIMKFLIADDIGFNYMRFYRQDKIEGAHEETKELKSIANIELHPHPDNKQKNIYKHGNFYFSSLICNELTDIENRMNLRGKIDALFAIEWNRDIKSFNALVESASLDIHSYIIQVNNRKYGDSRIRAPFSKDYKRDIVQVRGGKHDYLIVGEIDIEKLRDFQSHSVSPTSPFKPTPTGFEMLEERKKWKNEYDGDEE